MAEQSEIARLDPNMAAAETGKAVWHDGLAGGVEGKGWADTARPCDRLPARAEQIVRPPVWRIGRWSAGLAVRFRTDSPSISARWRLWSGYTALPHFAPTGSAGLDLYTRRDPKAGRWRWTGVGKPNDPPNCWATLASGLTGGPRDCLLYLPLYHGIDSLELGVVPGAAFELLGPRTDRPIVFYGTSIVNGGTASRPGMAYPAILGRRLDRLTINLGFSGNGQMEPEVAELLAELDPAAFVLDPLPNLMPAQVAERAEPFVRILRRARPATPILLVESIAYQDGHAVSARAERVAGSNAALRATFERLAPDDANLHYLAGDRLLGDDGEATVDGTHPTDLGFTRMADAIEPAIRKML